jgi:hypothetical protein
MCFYPLNTSPYPTLSPCAVAPRSYQCTEETINYEHIPKIHISKCSPIFPEPMNLALQHTVFCCRWYERRQRLHHEIALQELKTMHWTNPILGQSWKVLRVYLEHHFFIPWHWATTQLTFEFNPENTKKCTSCIICAFWIFGFWV